MEMRLFGTTVNCAGTTFILVPHQQEQPIVRVMITLIRRLGPVDQFPFSGVSILDRSGSGRSD